MSVALLAAEEAWMGRFCKGVMLEHFVHDRDIDSPDVVGRILRDLDLDPEPILVAASCAENKARLRQQTENALALGIFGAPMFRVGSELFLGNDRLDDALAAASAAEDLNSCCFTREQQECCDASEKSACRGSETATSSRFRCR